MKSLKIKLAENRSIKYLLKSSFLPLLFVLMGSNIHAQMRLGLRAATPSISSNEAYNELWNANDKVLYGLNYLSTKTSFSYGLAMYKELSKEDGTAWIMGEVLYKKQTTQYMVEMKSSLNRASSMKSDEYKIISVPVMAGWKKNNVKLGLGPVFNYNIESNLSLDDYEGFVVEDKKLKTGFQFLLGYVIKDRIHLDLKNEISFDGPGDDYSISGKPLNLKTLPSNFSLSVGIFL